MGLIDRLIVDFAATKQDIFLFRPPIKRRVSSSKCQMIAKQNLSIPHQDFLAIQVDFQSKDSPSNASRESSEILDVRIFLRIFLRTFLWFFFWSIMVHLPPSKEYEMTI